MVRPGRTPGRPNSAVGVKWYYKPSLGKMIGRMPGVVRKSASVLAVNMVLEGRAGGAEHPAVKCHGRSWKDFIACMRKEMRDLMGRTKAEREANARKLSEEYGIPISTKRKPVWQQLGR